MDGINVDCYVEFYANVPSMTFQLVENQMPINYWVDQIAETSRIFCAATNKSNRRAQVYMVIKEIKARQFECELKRWGEWRPISNDKMAL